MLSSTPLVGFPKDGFNQLTGGRAEEQTTLAQFRQLHGRIGNAKPFQLCPESLVTFEAETDMVPAVGLPILFCV